MKENCFDNGHVEAFRLLWKTTWDAGRNNQCMMFLHRNRRGKRALDFIFEHGHTILANVTRAAISDIECDACVSQRPEAKHWAADVLKLDHDKSSDPSTTDGRSSSRKRA